MTHACRTVAVSALLLGLSLAACRTALAPGSIPFTLNGKQLEVPVIQSGGLAEGNLWVVDGGIVSGNWARAYIGKPGDCPAAPSRDMYWTIPFLGARFGFTIDLSQAGCGCNAALTLNTMPGVAKDGTGAAGPLNDYYCDSAAVDGTYCEELDVMEANNRAFQTNPHHCDDRTETGFYPFCDRIGCPNNNFIKRGDPSDYGLGASFRIDTTKPFEVVTEFVSKNGTFADMIVTLKQGAKSVSLSLWPGCGSYDIARLTKGVERGLVIIMSQWGETGAGMRWLDTPPCDGVTDCVKKNVTYSKFWLETPQPLPVQPVTESSAVPDVRPDGSAAVSVSAAAALLIAAALSALF